jgi:glycosyltransferase involved in cell wall biosynthesis
MSAHVDGKPRLAATLTNQRKVWIIKLLERAVPASLRPPMRKVLVLLRRFPGLSPRPRKRAQLLPMWHRRLKRIWRRSLKRTWRRSLKPIWLRYVWRRLNRLRQRTGLLISHMHRPDHLVEASNHIHIISISGNLFGGSSLHAVHLFDELSKHGNVSLWTDYKVHPEMAEKYPIKQIVPERLEFPRNGTLVFVGSYFYLGPWIRYAYPRRVIVVAASTIPPAEFHRQLRKLSKMSHREVEVAHLSEFIRQSVNYPGPIDRSLIDIGRFVPSASEPSDSSPATFTVGRLSRADPVKHHSDDPALYRRLVDHGCSVKIMGPPPAFEAELGDLESVTLLPAFSQQAHSFLQGLDCFFYRISEESAEPWGRIVPEAMACGLPVVCHNRGGYVEIIDHGRNGFLFDTQQEALEILLRLKEDRALRESIGKAARETVEAFFSPARRSEIVEFYLR